MLDPSHPFAWSETFERLFSLSADEKAHLEELATPGEEIEPRRKLLTEGKPFGGLFILKSGWLVESKLLRDGRRQILNVRLPGDILGLESLAYRFALHSVTTLTRCMVAPLDVDAFDETQRRYPRLASAFFLLTLREEAILHEWEVSLGRRAAVPRVARLLLELDRRLRARGLATGDDMRLPLTQADMADSTGLTTAYVNRVLQKLRSLGLIRFEHQVLQILDRAELARSAGFDPDYIDGWGLGRVLLPPDAS